MSDGNFNRALLPHTPYTSGLKAGKQIAKMKAVELYKEHIKALQPSVTDDDLKALSERFEHDLASRL